MADVDRSKSKPKRVSAACLRCRRSKVRCSGTQPCARCRRRSRQCIYDDKDRRNAESDRSSISASLTQDLPREISQGASNRVTHTQTPGDPPSVPTLRSLQFETSQPESPAPYHENRPDKRRRWLYLGVASTASFSVRAVSMIRSCLPESDRQNDIHFILDSDAYSISWDRLSAKQQPELSDLPSIEHATYLMHTAKFHLQGLFKLFDENDFLQHMSEFYENAPDKVKTHRLWYIQYLLIMAFGTRLQDSGTSSDLVPGSNLFCRAMSIMPEIPALHEVPVIGVEVLGLISLYLYCLDMRQSAYSYIGQALRITLVEGNHTNLRGSQLPQQLAERCTNIWWSVYILDRTLSCAVGVPPSVGDHSVSNTLPPLQQSSQQAATLHIHVKLSRILSDILSEVYSANESLETSYLVKIRSILRDLAGMATEIEGAIDSKFKKSIDTISKNAAHLRLMYHQCIILSTRPLVLALLREKLKLLATGSESQSGVFPLVRDLLQTCVGSASKTLRMLHGLNRHGMLGGFLPFDMDFACSAASLLLVVDDVLRYITVDPSIKRLINKILQDMINKGNRAASLRLREMRQLEEYAQLLWRLPVVDGDTVQTFTKPLPTSMTSLDDSHQNEQSTGVATSNNQPARTNDYSQDPGKQASQDINTTPSHSLNLDFDLSQDDILMLADQLDVDALTNTLDLDQFAYQDWLDIG